MLLHPFPPAFNKGSRVLILGSFPSVKSRQYGFYYGHPRNRFWPLIAGILSETVPQSIDEKRAMLARHQIALWDVILSCDLAGSMDHNIKNPHPNDLPELIKKIPIQRILLNGQLAYKEYQRYFSDIPRPAVALPSTSPANAAWSLERLEEAWKPWLL